MLAPSLCCVVFHNVLCVYSLLACLVCSLKSSGSLRFVRSRRSPDRLSRMLPAKNLEPTNLLWICTPDFPYPLFLKGRRAVAGCMHHVQSSPVFTFSFTARLPRSFLRYSASFADSAGNASNPQIPQSSPSPTDNAMVDGQRMVYK